MNNSYNVENEKEEIQQSWWKQRSKMEKKLSIISILALLLIVILVIVLIVFLTRPSSTCISPSCVHITNELLQHMNTSVDPCQDFYQFACGNYMANTQLDEERVKNIEYTLFNVKNDRIRGIIEEPEHEDDPKSIILSKKFYKACTNESAINERGLKLVKDSLRQIGGWPTLEGNNWKEKEFEWKAVTYKLRELGYDFEFFIVMRIVVDQNNPTKRIIELDSPFNPLSSLHNDEEEELYNLMVNISEAFGAHSSRAKDDVREVMDFVKSLFGESEEREEDDKYDPLTISELQYKFREIAWLEYINRLQFPAPNISYDQIVSVTDASYFIRLQKALRTTPKRVLANYIVLRIIRGITFQLPTEVHELITKYFKKITQQSLPPRPQWCALLVADSFSLPLQAAYVKKHFSRSSKGHVSEILQSVKDEFKDYITNLKWMDEETRFKALERLSTSSSLVAYPNDLLDSDVVEKRYVGFQVDEENFLASSLNVNYYKTNLRFQKLHEPVEKDQELDEEYGAYHYTSFLSEENRIIIPAPILQGVIYDEQRPQYLNYGSLGSMLGHDIFHTVFEKQGSQKELKYHDWITTQTLLNYNKKLSCVAMHYGKYYLPEINQHLNSSNTKHEDAADIVGLKLAYDAYNKWASSNGPEQQLPGFDYTPKQLFWVSSAILHCSKNSPLDYEFRVEKSRKSPSKFRALGSLRNSKEFARDFNCPVEKYMNNEDKCEI